jgi:hypothetical protein
MPVFLISYLRMCSPLNVTLLSNHRHLKEKGLPRTWYATTMHMLCRRFAVISSKASAKHVHIVVAYHVHGRHFSERTRAARFPFKNKGANFFMLNRYFKPWFDVDVSKFWPKWTRETLKNTQLAQHRSRDAAYFVRLGQHLSTAAARSAFFRFDDLLCMRFSPVDSD